MQSSSDCCNAASDSMERMANSLIQACNEASAMTRCSMDASLQSATALARGCEDMMQCMTSLFQNAIGQNISASRAMMGARTLRDLMEAQSGFMRSGMEFMMSEMGRLSQISARTAQQAAEPVSNQMQATISRLSQSRAA